MNTTSSAPPLIWMGILIATGVLFSFALACGMPFAAIGALAALMFSAREAFLLSGLGWLANQVIGFGFLDYPLDAMTFAWGAALGCSAIAAVAVARFALSRIDTSALPLRVLISFAAAWAGQQGTVFVASLVLGGTSSAFAPAVVWFILWTNTVAFAGLFVAQIVGAKAGLANAAKQIA
ncbi:MAG: hypothetical protein AAFQ58_05410 [Pseudomonadota bacterium]